MMRRLAVFLAPTLGLFFVFSSCQVRQEVSLQIGASGSSRVTVELDRVFTRYYDDLATGLLPSFDPKNPVYFDTRALRENLAANPDLEVLAVRAASPDKLELDFRFRDISRAIQGGDREIRSILSHRLRGNQAELSIHLNRQNLRSLLGLLSLEGGSPLGSLLPPGGQPLSPEEYRDHLAWALEDYAPPGEIENILRSSRIDLRVRVPGKITSLTGGRIAGPSVGVFSLPLLELLTLPEPLDLFLAYGP